MFNISFPQNNDNVLPMTDATVKVSRYTVVNYDGRQYEVLDDLVVSEDHRLLVRTASDYEVDEKFTRRGDGTDMLLNSNGELIVGFPGTSRHSHHFVERILIPLPHSIPSSHIKISFSFTKRILTLCWQYGPLALDSWNESISFILNFRNIIPGEYLGRP